MMSPSEQALYDLACKYERSVADLHFKTFARMVREHFEAKVKDKLPSLYANIGNRPDITYGYKTVSTPEEINKITKMLDHSLEVVFMGSENGQFTGGIYTEKYRLKNKDYLLVVEDDQILEIHIYDL